MLLTKFSIINLLLPLLETHIFELADYDFLFPNEKESLIYRFLNHKLHNNKIIPSDKFNSQNSLFINNILHRNDENLRVKVFEEAFKDMLAMKTVTYVFKRDFFWRTWRQIEMEPGNKIMICYKCQNPQNFNCKKCNCGGYWVIEEKPPPCPYEIFSLKTDLKACVVNVTQYPNFHTSCPSKVAVRDLKELCDNPIETTWRISKKHTDVSKRNYDICQGRENCKISTSYLISPNSILFRIINSTNHVFYSRIMISGDKNYACFDDCGIMDQKTKVVFKNEQSLRLDSLKKDEQEGLLLRKSLPTYKDNQRPINSIDGYLSDLHHILKRIQTQKRLHRKAQKPNLYNGQSLCKEIEKKYKNNLYES